MFTKEEYKSFFDAVSDKEKELTFFLRGVIKQVEDKNLLSALEKIAADENKHYASVKNLLDSSLQQVEVERRESKREYHLGQVRMKNLRSRSEHQAKCVDISLTGLGIESEQDVSVGDKFELAINLFGYEETFNCFGELIWFKKISDNLYKGGIQYRDK